MWHGAAQILIAIALSTGPLAAVPARGDEGQMSAAEAHRAASRGEVLLIDIRSRREWRRTGLPAHGSRATIHGPDGMDGFLHRVMILTGGDRTREIALICAAGVRSARSRRFLVRHGFTRVRDVGEGMEGHGIFAAPDKRGWLRRGLPVERCGACEEAVPPAR